jgi:hypothetical protein
MDPLVDTDSDTQMNTADSDDDNDGFSDAKEAWIGTDSLDACRDDRNDDAWPADVDNDGRVVGLDAMRIRSAIGSQYGGTTYELDSCYNRRFDLSADGRVTGFDAMFVRLYIGIYYN